MCQNVFQDNLTHRDCTVFDKAATDHAQAYIGSAQGPISKSSFDLSIHQMQDSCRSLGRSPL